MPLIYYIPRRDAATGEITTVVDTSFSQTSLLISSNLALQSFNMDASNFDNDITVVGDARASSYTPYLPSWSVFLDGSGDYLSVPSNAAFAFGTSDFTVEAWIYPTALTTGILWASNEIGIASGWLFLTLSSAICWERYGNGLNGIITGPSIVANSWQHVAVTRSSGTLRLFVNGVTNGTTNDSTNNYVTMPYNFTIGADQNGDEGVFNGYISNLRVVKGTAVYTANFTPPTSPLTAIAGTSLLTLQDNRFIDKSPSNFAITKFGDTLVSPFNPFTAGTVTTPTSYSTYFDGSGDYLSVPSNTAFALGTSYTIELWHYRTGTASTGSYTSVMQLVNTNPYGSSVTGFMLTYDGSNAFNFRDSSSSIVLTYNSTNLALNTWYHVAIVRNGSGSNNMTMYINGVSVATGTSSGTQATNVPLVIGGDSNGNCSFPGYISNLRVVKGTAVYTSNYTPSTAPLTAITNTSLLTCQNSTLIDNSTNRFTISSFGQAQPNILNPFGSSSTTNNIVTTPTSYSTYFDGTGDYLSVAYNPAINILSGDFTVECWINHTSTQYDVIVSSWGQLGINSTDGWILATGANNELTIDWAAFSTGSPMITTANNVIQTGNWHHIAFTRNGNVFTLRVNGVSVGSATNSGSNTSQYKIDIGFYGNGSLGGSPTSFFNGYISNLRIVKGTALYTSNFTPSTAPLTAISGTSLLTCQNATLIDNSTNAFTITSFGQAQPSPINPFGANSSSYSSTYSSALTTPNTYSTYFDGSGDYLSIPTNSALDFGSGDFTIEAWVNPSSLSSDWFIISASGSGGLFVGFISSSPAGYGWGRNTIAWDYRVASTATLNTWQHVAVTRSGTSMRLFVNGVQAGTTQTISTAYNLSTTSTTIGSQGANWYLNGSISNLRVVKGTALYTSNFIPSTTPLTAVAGTSLLTCQNSTLIDNSTNNFTISSFGQAQPITANPFGANSSSYSSTYSSALTTPNTYSNYFDGTGDYLSIPYNNNFALNGNFTIECWLNFSAHNTFGGVVANSTAWQILFNSTTDNLRFEGTGVAFNTTVALTKDVWNHVALVRNGSTITFYINGVASGTASSSSTFDSLSSPVLIGCERTGGLFITGYVSNLRVVKGTAVYTANFTPSTTPLTAISGTSLLTCQNASFIDNSTSNFTITVTGNTTTSRVNPFGFTSTGTTALTRGSAYFDGTGDYLSIPASAEFAFTSSYTVEFWVYFNNITGTQDLVGNYVSSTAADWTIILTSSAIQYYPSSAATLVQSPTVVAGTWYHVAAVRNGTTCSLYLNGVLVGTSLTFSGTLGSAAKPLYIGTRTATGNYLNGYMSNLRVVKGTAVYTSNFLPPTEPLTAITNTVLLTCQNSNPHNNHTFINSATGTSNLVLTRSGNLTQTSISPYAASWGGYFNGSSYLSLPDDIQLEPEGSNLTWEMWINTTTSTQHATLFSRFPVAFSSGVWEMHINYSSATAGDVLVGMADYTGPAPFLLTTGVNVRDGFWHHIALVRNGSAWALYVDGISRATATWAGTVANISGGPRIGSSQQFPARNYTGYISNLRVVKGTALYTANFTPSTSPLTAVAGTALLTLQNDQFIDNSPNRFALTATGTPTPALNNNTQFALNTLPTPTTYSGYFDGTGDYLQIPYIADHALTTANFTIETWIYPLTTNVARGIANSWSAGGQIVLWLTSANKTSFVYSISGTSPTVTGATSISPNVWTHIAVVRNGTNLSIYVNGVLDLSHNIGTDSIIYSSGAKPLQIGLNADGGNPFNGYISNFRIVKGTAVYTSNYTPSTTPLTAISGTSLLTCQNSTFIDNSTNNSTITSFGQAKPSAINPFGSTSATANGYSVTKFKGSAYFDGTTDFLTVSTSLMFNLLGNFTIEAWVYPTALITNAWGIIDARVNGQTAQPWVMALANSSGYKLELYTGTALRGTTTIPLNTWTHIAWVRSGSALSSYVNGVRDYHNASFGTAAISPGSTSARIGSKDNTLAGYETQGYISDLRFANGTAIYTSNFLPSSVPLTPTPNTVLMLDGSAGSIVDATGKNPIETVGDARISDKAVKYGTTAMYFDGTGDYLLIPSSTDLELGSSNFTIEAWVYPIVGGIIYGKRPSSAVWGGFALSIDPSTRNVWFLADNDTSGPWAVQMTGSTVSLNTWSHIAVTRSGSTWTIWLNGVQSATATSSITVNTSSTSVSVGALSNGDVRLTGYISDLRFTKGTARYTANFTPPAAELPKL